MAFQKQSCFRFFRSSVSKDLIALALGCAATIAVSPSAAAPNQSLPLSVDFSVSVCGAEKFRSGVRRAGTAAKPVQVELAGARELWPADLPLPERGAHLLFSPDPPFSFNYVGKPSAELLKGWELKRSSRPLDAQRTEHTLTQH